MLCRRSDAIHHVRRDRPERTGVGKKRSGLLLTREYAADDGACYEFFKGSDLSHQLPEIMVPIQVHMIAVLVRVGFAAYSVSAEFAAEKIILFVQSDVEALLHQPSSCGDPGQTGADDYHFRHLASGVSFVIRIPVGLSPVIERKAMESTPLQVTYRAIFTQILLAQSAAICTLADVAARCSLLAGQQYQQELVKAARKIQPKDGIAGPTHPGRPELPGVSLPTLANSA